MLPFFFSFFFFFFVCVCVAAILFWLNCKSVYSYWQNEKKQLNEEVWDLEEMEDSC